jgi:hypothetical protein
MFNAFEYYNSREVKYIATTRPEPKPSQGPEKTAVVKE